MVEVDPVGAIRSRFVRGPYNALSDAGQFSHIIANNARGQYDNAFELDGELRARGGIKQAPSNPSLSGRIMDGDEATFWEPNPADPLSDWVLEIDLGRLVSATKVILRFAEEGDPFLQFRVHSAGGQNPFGTADRSGALDYVLVGGTTQPNREQRLFEFDLDPIGPHSDGWTGRMVQYVRIAVTDTRADRAEELSTASYQALPARERGAVEYIWRIAGEERLVSEEDYGQLTAAEQGGIRYFRRELPRLAEVEVQTVGENISLGLIERGGSLHDVNPNASPELAFDGNMSSEWSGVVYDITGETVEWGLLNVDLGAHFRVNAVRFVTRLLDGGGRVLYGYLLRGSDGARAPDGSFIWEDLSSEDRLLNQNTRLFEDRFDARVLRFLEFRNLDIARRTLAYLGHRVPSVVTEIEVYAEGYLPRLEMQSDLIDLGAAKNLTTIDWLADTPPGTEVEIRTRSGDDLREVKSFFKADGTQVANEEEYNKLPTFFQGEIQVELQPGQGWSNWSQAYDAPGARVLSPSPRRYMMVQARVSSDSEEAAATLRSIQVHFTPPLAQSIVGEIEPKQEVPIGVPADFELFVRSSFATRDSGFDRVRVVAPSRAAMLLARVDLGRESELTTMGMDDGYVRREDGALVSAAGQILTVSGQGTDSLFIELPRVQKRGGAEVLRLSFTSTVYQSGSTFAVEVGNSQDPDNWQSVDPGEGVGDELAVGEGLTVLTPIDSQIIKSERITSIFTPNGDGINDHAQFEFSVLKINTASPVEITISDVRGRVVRTLREVRSQANGLYQIDWDGLNERDQLVAPGIYVAHIGVDTERITGAIHLVSVAY
tara:strand:- start:1128 stop:3614 length:2487 start_codon:yes stop_codon:yes gene_type:complete